MRSAEESSSGLSDQKLGQRAAELREQAAENFEDTLFIEYGGLVAEAVFRSCGFRLHDVQVQAIVAGAAGAIVEMQTGEGKTVVTGAIAAMKSLNAPSVHVGTTNTYLAARDLENLTSLFDLAGITYGLLPEESDETSSRRAYRKQIVYGPGYQFGFDYLRDQMHLRANRSSRIGTTTANCIKGHDPLQSLIQSPDHHVALMDEADSVMIDEAMTPLIISLPSKELEDPAPYLMAQKIASEFVDGVDYTLTLPAKKIEISDAANQRAHNAITSTANLELSRPWRIYIVNAIRAERTFEKNVDYVVVDDQVQIVDQNTGRILPDRTWQDGLHQAVEAKENVPIQPGRQSTAQITRQRYLQLYSELAGLTGTAAAVTSEFKAIYNCRVVVIPTNMPSRRQVHRTRFFESFDSKLNAIAKEVVDRHAKSQPILIGTKTIRESRDVFEALQSKGLSPTVLNGVQDQEEAEIVAMAGRVGAITIATNMAGRGTDIKLDQPAIEAGGLHVIGVSPNGSKRIDRQLIGRSARQGQPGSAQFFAAATDAIFVDNQSTLRKQIARRTNRTGEARDFSRGLAALQLSIETRNFKQRQDMILRDRWMDSVRESIEKE
jgi:preprotein translocase subunit SecA